MLLKRLLIITESDFVMPESLKKAWLPLLIGIVIVISVSLVFFCRRDKKDTVAGSTIIYIGDNLIDDYTIVSASGSRSDNAASLLKEYIFKASGKTLRVSGKAQEKRIELSVVFGYAGDKIRINDSNVELIATSTDELLSVVYAFSNMYLGFSFAGEERERITAKSNVIYVPSKVNSESNIWMEEREPIVCLWKTNVPRGQYYNTNASLESELLSYSDDELYEYVRMLKHCGFTGVQVTDICAAWAQYGGYDFVHERLRYIADAAHSLGMKFTLWVWGAEFTGYGWVDDSVVYLDGNEYRYSYECPEAVATFKKYYKIYAELADCSDRVIMHFKDPSNICESEEVGFYAAMFRDMVKEINPDIDFGVSDYTHDYQLDILLQYLGNDVTFYSDPTIGDEENNRKFRTYCSLTGTRYGIWSWNLGEMEIDQLAKMNVNADIIKSVYQSSKAQDGILKPSYWAEMDSYHVLNIFSLYCEGHMLINPELEPDELLMVISRELVGKKNAEKLFETAKLIQDARSGESWDSFKWGLEDYIIESENYKSDTLFEEATKCLGYIDEMLNDESLECTIPFPVDAKTFLKLVRPHVEQIRRFAEFRMALNRAEDFLSEGVEKETLEKYVASMYKAIPNYNTLVGVWGQSEAISQYKMLSEFCAKAEITMPRDDVFIHNIKEYVYQEMIAYQKNRNYRNEYNIDDSNIMVTIMGRELIDTVVLELEEEGLIEKVGDYLFVVSDWEDYIFAWH